MNGSPVFISLGRFGLTGFSQILQRTFVEEFWNDGPTEEGGRGIGLSITEILFSLSLLKQNSDVCPPARTRKPRVGN